MQATVGAGLPVLSTLRSLTETGDRVDRIEGVFSGTLSYIFNSFGPGRPFSEVVAQAKAAGFTEPDPRDDLSGVFLQSYLQANTSMLHNSKQKKKQQSLLLSTDLGSLGLAA